MGETDKEITKLAELIKGKVVAEVKYTSADRFGGESVEADQGEVTIVFTDGSQVTAWNSEWGGVVYQPKVSPVGGKG